LTKKKRILSIYPDFPN